MYSYIFTALHCPTTSDVLSARPYTAPPRTRSDTTRSVPVPLGAPSAAGSHAHPARCTPPPSQRGQILPTHALQLKVQRAWRNATARDAGLAMSMRFAKAPDGKGYEPVLG